MLYGHGNGLQVMLCMREAFKKHSHTRVHSLKVFNKLCWLSLMKINIILLAISLLLYKLKLILWLEPSTELID